MAEDYKEHVYCKHCIVDCYSCAERLLLRLLVNTLNTVKNNVGFNLINW